MADTFWLEQYTRVLGQRIVSAEKRCEQLRRELDRERRLADRLAEALATQPASTLHLEILHQHRQTRMLPTLAQAAALEAVADAF